MLSLSGLMSAQGQDEHTPDAGESSPTYSNYEDAPESNKATEKHLLMLVRHREMNLGNKEV